MTVDENIKIQIAKELAIKSLESGDVSDQLMSAANFGEMGKMIAELFNSILKNIQC